ncbi:hypothetical protein G7Z17_g737 [Cylindrodendrum hubeiense]|uniref:FAD-binding PCMH-type domain-containing protein n=1 Tax=Cylindrodendrum hubeiense TaxID=595255 RepID=A0A9P5LKU2_9HYPO|nr:hypothetical protein G7Z17_g737 [Cylindrodendrum hubeiense]
MRVSQLTYALSLGGLISAAKDALDHPGDACAALAAAFPLDVAYPNTALYIQASNYWSDRQGEVHPRCFVTPRNTEAVSKVIKILTSRNALFTVKSGGHTAFAGSSSIANGVTIDLVYLNAITVSADRQTVSVGPGNRWINVSETLDPLKLAVVGGRVADVGVGGLLLGGGISYFSGLRGWACDNVRSFEVVLASGHIVNASPIANADLYWALRGGGGSNFGIVTRFDLASFEQGDMWSNYRIFPGALNTTLIPRFQSLTVDGLPNDPAAHSYLFLTYEPPRGGYIAVTSFYHATVPSPPESTPSVFAPFQSVPGAIDSLTLVANMSTQSRIPGIPYGSRQTWWDTTVSATSASLLLDIVPLFEASNKILFAAANGSSIVPFLIFHPIPVNVITAMQQNGGNTFGLKPSDGPLMLVQLATSWEDARLDALVEESSRQLIANIESMAKKRRLYNGFVYMNYAGSTQQVQRRYGKNNERKLKRIARKWDPQGKLARLWRGYFKL